MTASTCYLHHCAVVMDGNGRWASRRTLPRSAGHVAGLRSLRKLVTHVAMTKRVSILTCYAFSGDNWKRPPAEVAALMNLLAGAIVSEGRRCVENGIRVAVIGRRDRLSPEIRAAIERLENATRSGKNLLLRIAIDYSARWILESAAMGEGPFRERLARVMHDPAGAPDVDLVIRTAGEQRLSDFLLYESAYAELYFTPKLWPEFSGADFDVALEWFGQRQRKFGDVA